MEENQVESRIEFVSQLPLPSLVLATMKAQLAAFHQRHAQRYRYAILRATLRKADDKVGCDALLFNDQQTEQVYVESHDPREALSDALDTLHIRIVRAFEESLASPRNLVYEDRRGEVWYADEVAQLSAWERDELGIRTGQET